VIEILTSQYSLGPCVIPWVFHGRFGFFAELYALKGADSQKKCRQFFLKSFKALDYAN
jgi:hypothetical protein